MRSTTIFVSLTVAMLASAGCGSTKPGTTTILGVTHFKRPPPVNIATYNVGLAGYPAGALNGSAVASITLNGPQEKLCWAFSALMNLPRPTVARIFAYSPGGAGEGGFPLGHTYSPSGCRHVPREVLNELAAHPEHFYVSIHTAHFPGGAVHGPL